MSTRWLVVVAVATVLTGATAPSALAAAPANDGYGNAAATGSLPFETTADSTEATVSAGDPGCASATHTVWYRFTPTVSGTYTFDANGLWDTGGPALGVFTGHRRSASLIACDDAIGGEDFGGIAADRVTLTAGIRYHIMVGSSVGVGGTTAPGGMLFVRAVRYAPVRVKVHVFAGTVDRDTGVLTLTGTVACQGTYAEGAFTGFPDVSATARQLRTTWLARGTGGTWPTAGCTPSAAWTMTIFQTGSSHPFMPGPATITARGYECNLWECVTHVTKAKISLEWG